MFLAPLLVKTIVVNTPIRFYVRCAEPWQPCVGIFKVKHTNGNSCKYLTYSAPQNEHENVPVWNQFVDAEPHRLFFALTCWLPRQHCTLETNLSQTQPLIVFESVNVGEEPFVPKPWTLWRRAAHSGKSRALEMLWWTELPFRKLNQHLCNCCHRNAHKLVFPLTDSNPSSRDKLSYAWLSWSCLLFFLEQKTKTLFPLQADLNSSPGLQRETESMFTKNCLCHWKRTPPPTS